MNLLTVIVIALLILYAFWGYKAGLIKTIFSICSMIVALALTFVISPQISKALQANEKVVGYFSEKVQNAMNLDKITNSITDKASEIDKLPIPESFKESLKENNTVEAQVALGVNNFSDYLSHSIACMIINTLCFVVIFLVLIVGLKILCTVLNIISKLPVLHQINKFTGLLAGLARGLIAIWLLCIILVLFSSTTWGKACFEMINESVFLSILYNNNLLIQFVADISKSIM